jgi:hypothetical protein
MGGHTLVPDISFAVKECPLLSTDRLDHPRRDFYRNETQPDDCIES